VNNPKIKVKAQLEKGKKRRRPAGTEHVQPTPKPKQDRRSTKTSIPTKQAEVERGDCELIGTGWAKSLGETPERESLSEVHGLDATQRQGSKSRKRQA